MADHDSGLLALLAGEHERAEAMLRPGARGRIRRAAGRGAPAPSGGAGATRARGRGRRRDPCRGALEPVRAADRPGVLVAMMAFAQALSARARGDRELAAGPGCARPSATGAGCGDADASREHLASLVDLGRPPVAGVVDPSRELDRVAAELRGLEALADVR